MLWIIAWLLIILICFKVFWLLGILSIVVSLGLLIG